MKKALSFILTIAMLASFMLVGCTPAADGGESSPVDSTPAETPESTPEETPVATDPESTPEATPAVTEPESTPAETEPEEEIVLDEVVEEIAE